MIKPLLLGTDILTFCSAFIVRINDVL